jgi:hypothetical protein
MFRCEEINFCNMTFRRNSQKYEDSVKFCQHFAKYRFAKFRIQPISYLFGRYYRIEADVLVILPEIPRYTWGGVGTLLDKY